jgi:uncharacterized phiE125 gp8 family phage protein
LKKSLLEVGKRKVGVRWLNPKKFVEYLRKKQNDMTIEFTSTTDASSVLSTDDAKDFLRVTSADEDALVGALRNAAVRYVEDYCNTHFGQDTAVLYLDGFFNVRVPICPVVSIESVSYYDVGNTLQALAVSGYYYDLKSTVARIAWNDPPSVYDDTLNAVQVNLTIGHAVDEIPEPVIHAIKLLTAHFYDRRNLVAAGRNVEEVPFAVSALLNPYRIL